jgi:16S rRNA (cytosine967-C5)-methyltransferase
MTIRANTLRTTRESLALRIEPEVEGLRATRISPDGLSFSGAKVPVVELPGFREGEFQVQDEAAQLAGLMAAPKPGEKVLDACAGLGGKTGHLAQLMTNRGKILSIDRDEKKLIRLRAEMERLGVGIVETLLIDIDQPDPGFIRENEGTFDRIMLDAPCSGLGVLRRNPDARWDDEKRSLKRFQKRQLRFLDRVAPFLKPGGMLVYAVCSAEPEENEEVVEIFLSRHPEFEPNKSGGGIYGKESFKTHPHRDEMDGFFAARFRKKKVRGR